MDRKDILKALIEILKKNQKEIGAEDDVINEKTIPIEHLTNFDSLTSVMITARCFDEFSITNDVKFVSLFIEKKEKGVGKGNLCALTVGQAADRILTLLSKE